MANPRQGRRTTAQAPAHAPVKADGAPIKAAVFAVLLGLFSLLLLALAHLVAGQHWLVLLVAAPLALYVYKQGQQ